MKILKLCAIEQSSYNHYRVIFDEIPPLTYERVGADYIGSACMDDGTIICSSYLKKGWHGAFAGRTLALTMKDGSVERISDYWWDNGPYPEHGKFIQIGGETVSGLQNCYVYCGMYIAKEAFEKMLEDYFQRDRSYGYKELRHWVFLQNHTWYPVIIDGKPCGLQVNEKGQFMAPETQKQVYCRHNVLVCRYQWKGKTDKHFRLCLFHWTDAQGRHIERNLKQVYRASLPEEISVPLIEALEKGA